MVRQRFTKAFRNITKRSIQDAYITTDILIILLKLMALLNMLFYYLRLFSSFIVIHNFLTHIFQVLAPSLLPYLNVHMMISLLKPGNQVFNYNITVCLKLMCLFVFLIKTHPCLFFYDIYLSFFGLLKKFHCEQQN